MTIMIISVFGLFVTTVAVYGVGFTTICILSSTVLFSLRKIGFICSLKSILAWEVVAIVISTAIKIVFSRFILYKFIIYLLLRIIFILIVLYDKEFYVYVTKEERIDYGEDN